MAKNCAHAAWAGFGAWSAWALLACAGGPNPAVAGPTPPPSESSLASPGAGQQAMAPVLSPATTKASPYPPAQNLSLLPQGRLTLGEASLSVAIAEEPRSQTYGLSGQPSLAQGQGLLFVWPVERILSIWMPDMNFPIDVLFFRQNELRAIFPDAQPCPNRQNCRSFGPDELCDTVLEIGAGEAARLKLQVGQRFTLTR